MIMIEGVLVDPLGLPMCKTVIRFTSLGSEGNTYNQISSLYHTNEEGWYKFRLNYGRYLVAIYQEREFKEVSEVLVDEHTPSPINLIDLILYSSPYEPPLFDPTKPDWKRLFGNVKINDELHRQAEEQVRLGEQFVNEDMRISRADKSYLSENTHTVNFEKTRQRIQQIVYKDNSAREASVIGFESDTETSKAIASLEAYKHSDGSTEAISNHELISLSGSNSLRQDALSKTHLIKSGAAEVLTKSNAEGEALSTDKASLNLGDFKAGISEVTNGVSYVGGDDYVVAASGKSVSLNMQRNDFPLEGCEQLSAHPVSGVTHEIMADKHIILARDGFPVATFDTETRSITFDASLTFKNTDDFIGEEGWSYDHKYQYSVDRETWRDNYEWGDPWRKDQKIKFKESNPSTYIEIGEPQIIQLNAQDGADGDNFYIEYQYTTAEEYPVGWRPVYENGDDWRRWRTVRKNDGSVELGKWQNEPIKGADGPEGFIPEFQVYYGPDGTKPIEVDLDADGSVDSINLEFWHTNFSNGDYYKYERRVWWATQERFFASRKDTSLVPDVIEPWVGPIKFKPEYGVDYTDGKHGAGSYIYVGIAEADLYLQDHEVNLVTVKGSAAVKQDILTYIDKSPDATYSKSFLRNADKADPLWEPFQFQFDGNVIINGTLAAESLKAETALLDKLYISSTKSRSELVLSGRGSLTSTDPDDEFRLWVGHEDPNLAPAWIKKNGDSQFLNLRANDVEVGGKLTVEGGSFFKGDIQAPDSVIHGAEIRAGFINGGVIYADRIIASSNLYACLGDNVTTRDYPSGPSAGQRVACQPQISRSYAVNHGGHDGSYKPFLTDVHPAGDLYIGDRFARTRYLTIPRGTIKISISQYRENRDRFAGFQIRMRGRDNSVVGESPKFQTAHGPYLSVGSRFTVGPLKFIVTSGGVPHGGGFDISFENEQCNYGWGWTTDARSSFYLDMCQFSAHDGASSMRVNFNLNNGVDAR